MVIVIKHNGYPFRGCKPEPPKFPSPDVIGT